MRGCRFFSQYTINGGGGGLNELVRSGSQTFIKYLKRHRILIPYKYVFQGCYNSNNLWGLHCWDEFKNIIFSSPLLNFKPFFSSLSLSLKGDLFECMEDLENPHLWQQSSEKPELQEQHRADILQLADVIIPGHGSMFQVPDSYKRQMQMVLLFEEFTESFQMASLGHKTWNE